MAKQLPARWFTPLKSRYRLQLCYSFKGLQVSRFAVVITTSTHYNESKKEVAALNSEQTRPTMQCTVLYSILPQSRGTYSAALAEQQRWELTH